MPNKLDFSTGEWYVHINQLKITHKATSSTVILEPRLVDLLLCLTRKRGEVVTKQELINEVWHGSIVADDSISKAISRLRNALQDNPKKPAYIETVWKRGYRWIPEVIQLSEANSFETVHHPEKKLNPTYIGIIVLALIMAAYLFMSIETRNTFDSVGLAVMNMKPLTSGDGNEDRGQFSDDGTYVVFQAGSLSNEKQRIKTQKTDGSSGQLIGDAGHGGFDDYSPLFSDDNNHISYMRFYLNDTCEIRQTSLVSGKDSVITTCTGSQYADLDYFSSKEIYVFSRQQETDPANAIYIFHNQTLKQVSFPPSGSWGDFDPAISPDGKKISFTRAYTEMQHDLFIIDDFKAEALDYTEKQLTKKRTAILGSSWTPESYHLVFSSRQGVNYRLNQLDLMTGGIKPIYVTSADIISPHVSKQGHLLATKRTFDTDLIKISLNPIDNSIQKLTVFDSTHWDIAPTINTDDQSLVFVSDRSGHFQLWLGDLTSGATKPLTAFADTYVLSPRFSNDDSQVVFAVHEGSYSQIYLYHLADGSLLKITDDRSFNSIPSFSTQGDDIYFASNRTGQWQLWQQPVAGGDARQFSTTGGYAALPSRDGRWLHFTKYHEFGLWRTDLSDHSTQLLTADLSPDDWGAFAVNDIGVYYLDRTKGEHGALMFIHHEKPDPISIYTLQSPTPRHTSVLSVNQTGTQLYLTESKPPNSDLVYVKDAFVEK